MTRIRFVLICLIGAVGALGCVFVPDGPSPTRSTADTSRTSGVKKGPLYGQVIDDAGKPVPNVTVRAYLADTSPLIGNSGSGLAGNSGGALTGNAPYITLAARGLASSLEGKTDGVGGFVFSPDKDGKYNIEAVESDTSKAWRSAVEFKAGSDTITAGTLRLGPTGNILGKVQAADQGVTDFQNTQVYIPGSGYLAVTGADGNFRIPNVPIGKFGLHAFNQFLGDADAGPDAVAVQPNKDTAAPPLVMSVARPELSFVTRLGTDQRTDNAGAGAVLVLRGKNFGKSRGAPFSVLFNGASATAVSVKTDEMAEVTVPDTAANGEVYLRVGFNESNHLKFRLIKSFRLLNPAPVPASGSCSYDFAQDVDASDGQAGFRLTDRLDLVPPVYKANISWRTTRPDIGRITPDGLFVGNTTGEVQVQGQAGPNLLAVVTVHVTGPCTGASAGSTPTPMPPAPSPTPSPNATPAPTPTPASTATPAPYALRVTIRPVSPPTLVLPGTDLGSDVFPASVLLTAEILLSDGATASAANWSSSAQTVATVDSGGLVRAALSAGTATITATSKDGMASAAVTVAVAEAGQAEVEVQ